MGARERNPCFNLMPEQNRLMPFDGSLNLLAHAVKM